jgi:hypothetical protein
MLIKGASWRVNVTVVGSDGFGEEEKIHFLAACMRPKQSKRLPVVRYEVSFVRFSALNLESRP